MPLVDGRAMIVDGRLHIARVTSNTGPDEIRIELTDDKAAVKFAVAKLSLEDFARAVTMLNVDCHIEVRGLHRVGKVMEHKTVAVQIPPEARASYSGQWHAAMLEAVEPYEVDGWKHDDYDIRTCNGHRRHGNSYDVTFRRWTEPPAVAESVGAES